MIEDILAYTSTYLTSQQKENRKQKGQFFTTENIAKFMAAKSSCKADHLSILDPGAGNGLLAATVVEYCVDNSLCNSFSITYVENDPEVMPVLDQTVAILTEYVQRNHGKIDVEILTYNYILNVNKKRYDIVICNPPYKKIRKDSEESVAMKEYVHGQPNLYGLFMCKALENLKNGGRYVFITPRSWTSGAYYEKVRQCLFPNLNLTDILLFTNRENVFGKEDVLQETMITCGVKGITQERYINIYTSTETIFSPVQMEVPTDIIKNVSDHHYLLLPATEKDLEVIVKMTSIKDTFESLGYCFKTGPVVEFRNKDLLSKHKGKGLLPMYRSANIVDGKFVFPAKVNKPQYVQRTSPSLLIKNENTILLRRLSAKEEKRRLQSCVYYKKGINHYISIENHVNYLVHTDGTPLSEAEVEWIQDVLMSEDYDIYFRIINGSTQVNASELNKLPLQRRTL